MRWFVHLCLDEMQKRTRGKVGCKVTLGELDLLLSQVHKHYNVSMMYYNQVVSSDLAVC